MTKLIELFEKHFLFRRLFVLWMAGLMTWVIYAGVTWALASERPGTEIAMILGAVFGSLTLLQGAVTAVLFKFYNDSRAG